MKTFNKSEFFKELGLENLPASYKDNVWVKFTELVSLEVLDKTLAQLSEKEQELLFLNLAKNPKEVEKFLAKNRKLRKITSEAIIKIKKQIAKKLSK